MRRVRDNWIGLLIIGVILVGLALSFHQNSVNDDAARRTAISQSQFNLRTCTKGAELRDQGNQVARVVNEVKHITFTITKAAAESSGDPSEARARYGALADQLRALPDVKELPPTDCAAIVKLYSPEP